MTRTRTFTMLTAAAAIAAIGGLATPARAPHISEARIKELIKQAAERAQTTDTTQPKAASTGEARPPA